MNYIDTEIDYIVDENSPQIEQPVDITIPLKPHQLALIHKMIELEKPKMKVLNQENSEWFKTDFGAICDKVGAGKSLTVLGLISNKKILKPGDKCFKSYGHMVHMYSKSQLYLPINIIVVPHGIISQWESYIEEYTLLKSFILKNTVTLNEFKEKLRNFRENNTTEDYILEEEFDMDIVLISSSQYNKIAKVINYGDSHHIVKPISISRLIIDEVDSIKVPSSEQIGAEFSWFISSSTHKLQNPNGYRVQEPYTYTNWQGEEVHNMRTVTIDRMVHSGFFRNLLINLENLPFRKHIFLKSKEEFVENSFKLPPIKFNIIRCLGNIYVNVLNGLVPQEVMNMINAGDINSAVNAIGCDTQDEEGLIKLVTKDLEKTLKNKKLELTAKQQMEYSSAAAKKTAIDKLTIDISQLEEKINSITERVIDTNACPICYDEISNKSILQCCNNAFCLECITMSLNHKPNCPLCRKLIGKKDMIVIKEEFEEQLEDLEEDEDSKRTKLENLKLYLDNIMSKNKKSKVKKSRKKILIFSEYEQSFNEIETYLKESTYTYDKLKGSTIAINNKVIKYKDDEIDILLLNSKYFGSGLNLENTTDMFLLHKMTETMEKQVIGRAQRPGRKEPLKVYRLCYENEV
jgi:SNF2 family DNA or RNA helicase